MVKITKTITQPEEVINAFADWRGYQEMVKNPDFVPAQGSPKILDPEHELQDGENPETTDGTKESGDTSNYLYSN